LLSGSFVILSLGVFRWRVNWPSLIFTIKPSDLVGLLSPLVFAAAVVERAVEILVSPWRDAGADKLEKAIAAIKTRPANPATAQQDAADLKTASDTLDEYRGVTQQYAFAVSVTLSILVSIAGIRMFGSLLTAGKPAGTTTPVNSQYLFLAWVDVALSAALMAGGADGIHSVVNAFTSFFDSTADKTKA
jgi:hypothetical protein